MVGCVACWIKQNGDVGTETLKDVLSQVRLSLVSSESIETLMKVTVIEENPG